MDIKSLLASLGVLLGLIGTFPYIRDTLRGKTKPHVITWLIWTLLALVAFAGQLVGGGGPGAYVTGVTAMMNAVILVLSVRFSKTLVTRFDIGLLTVAMLALPLWWIAGSPIISVVLASVIMIIGYIPTYQKSWMLPERETVSLFAFSALKQLFGLLGLAAYNVLTVLFPLSLLIANLGLVFVILMRRREVGAKLPDSLA